MISNTVDIFTNCTKELMSINPKGSNFKLLSSMSFRQVSPFQQLTSAINCTVINPIDEVLNACSEDLLHTKQKALERALKSLKEKKGDPKQHRGLIERSRKANEITGEDNESAITANKYARLLIIDFCKQALDIEILAHFILPERIIAVLQQHCYQISPSVNLQEILISTPEQGEAFNDFITIAAKQSSVLDNLDLQLKGITTAENKRISISTISKSGEITIVEKTSLILVESDYLSGSKWKPRICQVKNGIFSLYKENVKKPIISIPIITCSIQDVELRSRRFNIISATIFKKLRLMCETESEFRQWVDVFSAAQKRSIFSAMNSIDKNGKQSMGALISVASSKDNIIEQVRSSPGNDKCCDCKAEAPDWIVINLGICICIECCGVHRDFGVHISKTQSLDMDYIRPEILLLAVSIGNAKFNAVFEEIFDSSDDKSYANIIQERGRKLAADDKYIKRMFVKKSQPISFEQIKAALEYHDILTVLRAHAERFEFLKPNHQDKNQWSALFYAIQFYDEQMPEILEFILLNAQPSSLATPSLIDMPDIDGNCPIHIAVQYNHPMAVQSLIDHGANYFILNCKGLSAINFAQQFGYKECLGIFNSTSPTLAKTMSVGAIHSDVEDSSESLTGDKSLKPTKSVRRKRGMFLSKRSIGF
ncbi:hypothetical protein ACOME3_006875 [Neoechinorhynchus agilis]